MTRWAWRVLGAVATGAVLGAAGVVLAYARNPSLILEMDRDLAAESGVRFYPVDRAGGTHRRGHPAEPISNWRG